MITYNKKTDLLISSC